ncbi:HET-domain-containing protein [Bimuria novae-zelandiae CBS 107.79]|uniref:HET-domain-containing protein n=1 Tax=Bimuria novae-zelandiae CBS 107.79 TaxID=1447943 RepID=A0A6A5UUR7_9PLEO|nr:HET-domain-containing protein [Bimuria novae-zelandiae CBS 107.79]
MGCLSTLWTALKGDLRRDPRQGTADSLEKTDEEVTIDPTPTESPSDEPAEHRFLKRRETTATTTSSFTVSERSRRYTNDSLSSLARSQEPRKTARRNTDDRISSQITNFRRRVRRRRTSDSDEMANSITELRRRKRKCLRDDIKAAMVLQGNPDLQFIPACALEQLFQQTTVERTLEGHRSSFKTEIQSLKSYICSEAMKLFAILAWAESEPLIEQFYQNQFRDQHLPVDCRINEEDFVEAFRLGNLRIDKHPFNNYQWTDRNIEDFCYNYQWPFLSPVFSQDQFRYHFHERTRMPFMEERHRSQKESFFSVVEEWRIHRDHIRTPKLVRIPDQENEHPVVAVKKLKQMDLKDPEFDAVARAEVEALELIRNLEHPHLVNAVAYYTKGKNHYIIFPWASRGNLRDFWERDPPKLDHKFLTWVFAQLCGLAEALRVLHHSHQERSTRHGDLKPENILCFDDLNKDHSEEVTSSRLVIADVGLSRSHNEITAVRKGATRTQSGTIKYEPPETELQPNEPRTRRYDVWSLGCIYVEFVIWMLYGPGELDHFRDDLSTLGENTRFYVIEKAVGVQHRTAHVNGVVQKWVDWIKNDPRCQGPTAVRSLVDLILARLLIVDVSPPSRFRSLHVPTLLEVNSMPSADVPSIRFRAPTFDFSVSSNSVAQSRASAEEVDDAMKSIVERASLTAEDRLDWINWNVPTQSGPKRYGNRLISSDAAERRDAQNEYRFTPLDDNWKYAPDAEIAQLLFADPNVRASASPVLKEPKLCPRCETLPIWMPKHSFSDTLASLKQRLHSCDLCRLLAKHVESHVDDDHEVVPFFRVGSSLTVGNRQQLPILSLYSTQSESTLGFNGSSHELQLGFSNLPEPGSPAHLKVLTWWIRNCDNDHQCSPKNETFLPTRVLDVGTDSDIVSLFCDTQGDTHLGRYMTLSHRWGAPTQHRKFCTYRSNIAQHRLGMNIADFPKTFQDAVKIARALGIKYLWIDSLCIIQDDEQDWETESKLMEQVFSCAYITVAASCASGTTDGFLRTRPPRDSVTLRAKNVSHYYVCDAIDDFKSDVDQGELNRRGWVLQERALSRRTLYFTEKQTYWECGNGIRCETLTKMNNKKASFLGDANFPNSIDTYVKGTKIQLFQSLYEKYATLDLSYSEDRPIAIKGLEKRLIRTLQTTGGYGVFQRYMHRCLLWQRSGNALRRIETFRGDPTPSWSWMAYVGAIKYMDVPFGRVTWAEDIQSPWSASDSIHAPCGVYEQDNDQAVLQPRGIRALAWELLNMCSPKNLILDDPSRCNSRSLRYVIVGTEKSYAPTDRELVDMYSPENSVLNDPGRSSSQTDRKVYVLVVANTLGEKDVHERVGVGVLQESLIWWSKPPLSIWLI